MTGKIRFIPKSSDSAQSSILFPSNIHTSLPSSTTQLKSLFTVRPLPTIQHVVIASSSEWMLHVYSNHLALKVCYPSSVCISILEVSWELQYGLCYFCWWLQNYLVKEIIGDSLVGRRVPKGFVLKLNFHFRHAIFICSDWGWVLQSLRRG